MAQSMSMRATSFAASATILGLAALAAMTMTITQQTLVFNDPPVVPTFTEAPEPIVEPPREVHELPRIIEDVIFAPVASTLPTTPSEPAAATDLPVAQQPPLVVNPEWVRRPAGLDRYYPRRALERGMEGQVVLDCNVATSGRLNCAVVSETPENWGFGAAALEISRDYQMVPAMRNGVPIEARHRMSVPFRVRS